SPRKFMRSRLHGTLTEFQVKLERLRHRPLVLKSLKAPGRKPSARCSSRRIFAQHPRLANAAVHKRRNSGRHILPAAFTCPHEARSPWAEKPFMAPGDKIVTAQVLHLYILNTEAMHTVYDEQYFLPLFTFGVDLLYAVCDRLDR